MTEHTINPVVETVLATLRKGNKNASEEDLVSLAEIIMADAEGRHQEVAGFYNKPSKTLSSKDFGEMITDGGEIINIPEKKLKWKVADTDTIFLPNSNGDAEAFAFDPLTLEKLGAKLEGIPVVIGGEGHDSELPMAAFTGDYEVVEETTDTGKKIKVLYQWSKLRSDEDSPIDFESLVKNPVWDINGGEHSLNGSLRFTSRDIPYYYGDGSKVNYMTSPVPIHYAGVDSPVIRGAGLVEKNFGEIMTKEVETPEAKAPVVDAPDVTAQVKEMLAEKLGALDIAALVKEGAVAEITAQVVKAVANPEVIARSEYEAVLKERDELIEARETAELDGLRNEIVDKSLGADASEEDVAAFVEDIKSFGKTELQGILRGLTLAAEKTADAPAEKKNFGKGKVDTANPEKKRKFPQIQI